MSFFGGLTGGGGTVLDRLVVQLVAQPHTRGIQQFMQGMNQLERKIDTIAGKLEAMSGPMMKVGAGAAGMATGMLIEAGRVEAGYAKISAATAVPAKAMDFLRGKVSELGAELGRAESTLVQGLYPILSGIDVRTDTGIQKAAEILRVATMMSETGFGEVELLARALTTAAGNLKDLPIEDLGEMLAQAVEAGNFAPEELAGAIPRILTPVMGGILPLEEMLAGAAMGTKIMGLGLNDAVRNISTGFLLKLTAGQGMSGSVLGALARHVDGVTDKLGMGGYFGEILKGERTTAAGQTGLLGTLRELERLIRLEAEGNPLLERKLWLQLVQNRQETLMLLQGIMRRSEEFDAIVTSMADPRELLERFKYTKGTIGIMFVDMVDAFGNVAAAFGEHMLPISKKLVKWSENFANWLRTLPDGLQRFVSVAIIAGATLLPLGLGLRIVAIALRSIQRILPAVARFLGGETVVAATQAAKATTAAGFWRCWPWW